jgi:hypothetical protein
MMILVYILLLLLSTRTPALSLKRSVFNFIPFSSTSSRLYGIEKSQSPVHAAFSYTYGPNNFGITDFIAVMLHIMLYLYVMLGDIMGNQDTQIHIVGNFTPFERVVRFN